MMRAEMTWSLVVHKEGQFKAVITMETEEEAEAEARILQSIEKARVYYWEVKDSWKLP
jgi:hypothetical protein